MPEDLYQRATAASEDIQITSGVRITSQRLLHLTR
jgi:hypothetical protein